MDKLSILIFGILILFSCKKNNSVTVERASELITINLTVDGRNRSFLLYKPTGYNIAGNMPLVFVNHGGQGTAQGMMQLTDFRALSDRDKFILIYPQGFQNTWNDGRPTTANQLKVDDVNFFRQLCDYAVNNLSVDNSRIYVTGVSNGGFMASRLGCELGDRIAAIAVVGATFEQGVYSNCSPNKSIPSIIIQGTLDPFVPFNGGTVLPGAGGIAVSHTQAISKWTNINNCQTTAITTNLPDISNDGTTIMQNRYLGGINGSEVVGYVVINGGHTWPQGLQYAPETTIGKTSQNMNANEVIWTFFKRFKRD